MKFSKPIGILYFFLICVSCDVITLSEEQAGIINFEDIYPNSSEACREYLVGSGEKSWTIDQFTLSSIMGFQQCRLDDSIRLNNDGTFTYDGGEILCGGEDNTTIKTGTWSIDHNSRTISFQIEGFGTEQLFVEMLTDSEVVLSGEYFEFDVVGKFTRK